MQKARRHIPKNAPTACRHAVSCTISLPFRGYFSPFPHGTSPLSVTREYLALEGGPPKSDRVSRVRSYSGTTARGFELSSTGLLPSVVSEFHCSSTSSELCDSRRVRHNPDGRPTTPDRQRVPAYACQV